MRDHGAVTYDGVTYRLTTEAEASNYGTDGDVRYYANAIPVSGVGPVVRVTWATTPEWDDHQTPDCADHDEGERTCAWCEDAANACDWDAPIAVEVI